MEHNSQALSGPRPVPESARLRRRSESWPPGAHVPPARRPWPHVAAGGASSRPGLGDGLLEEGPRGSRECILVLRPDAPVGRPPVPPSRGPTQSRKVSTTSAPIAIGKLLRTDACALLQLLREQRPRPERRGRQRVEGDDTRPRTLAAMTSPTSTVPACHPFSLALAQGLIDQVGVDVDAAPRAPTSSPRRSQCHRPAPQVVDDLVAADLGQLEHTLHDVLGRGHEQRSRFLGVFGPGQGGRAPTTSTATRAATVRTPDL